MNLEQDPLISIALPIAIAIVMCGIGLHLTVSDFRRVVRFPKSVLVGLAGHYIFLPSLGFAVAWAFRLPPELAVGLVLVTACPSGNISNTLTFLARGNVALAVTLTVVSGLVTFVSIPLLVALATDAFAGETQIIRAPVGETVKHLAGVLLVPIVSGMAIRHFAPRFAHRAELWVSKLAVALLAALIIGIAITQRQMLPGALVQAGPAAMTLCCLAIGGGFLLARVARLPFPDALTIGLEVGVQNAAVAILIALSLLKSPQIAIPGALYGVMMYAPALVVVAIGRRRLQRATAPAAATGAAQP